MDFLQKNVVDAIVSATMKRHGTVLRECTSIHRSRPYEARFLPFLLERADHIEILKVHKGAGRTDLPNAAVIVHFLLAITGKEQCN